MSIRKTLTGVTLALACVVALAPAPALAGDHPKTRVIVGKTWGTVTFDVRTLEVNAEVSAVLSGIGKITAEAFPIERVVVDGVPHVRGTFLWTHSSGDTITGTYTAVGQGAPTEVHTADWTMTVTGGTGRFAEATGKSWVQLTLTPFQGPPIIAEHLEGITTGWIRY